MAQMQKRAAPRQRTAPLQNTKSLDSFDLQSIAADPVRQVAPAAWIARRFGLPPATAALVVELAGIGAAV